MSTFPPVDPAILTRAGSEPLRERLAALIAGWVADGQIRPGMRFPPVRDAALHFQVDKGTMVRVYRLLVERGVVESVGRSTRATLVAPAAASAGQMHRTLAVVTDIRAQDLQERAGSPGSSLALAHGILATAHAAGWSVLFQHVDALAGDGPLPAAAVITSPLPGATQLIERLVAARVPVAVYGDVIAQPGCDRVVSDHAAGTRALVALMAAQGRRRILLHLPARDLPWVQARLDGYRAGMAAAGLEALPPLTALDTGLFPDSEAALATGLRRIAGGLVEHLTGERPVDCILAVSDGEALQIAGAVALFHRRVHQEVAVCGYDDYWSSAIEHTRFGLPAPCATVDKGNAALGRSLVELALERAAGRLPAEPQERLLAPRVLTVPPATV